MSDMDTRNGGNIVIGVMLVLVGAALTLDRAGVLHWTGQWSLWPLILGGIGVARFVGTPAGEPKQGLIFMTAAAWLFLAGTGWIAIEDSWPIVVIVIGLIIALNGGRRRPWSAPEPPGAPGVPPVPGAASATAGEPPYFRGRGRHRHRHRRTLTPLAVLGIWIAIFVALRVSGGPATAISRFTDTSASSGRIHLVSVMGRGTHVSGATPFERAVVVNVMGRSEIDLREAVLTPGESRELEVVSLMGAVVVRVPPNWTIDTGAIPAMGRVRDERFKSLDAGPSANAGPPPRLVLRGLVMMGRLSIRS